LSSEEKPALFCCFLFIYYISIQSGISNDTRKPKFRCVTHWFYNLSFLLIVSINKHIVLFRKQHPLYSNARLIVSSFLFRQQTSHSSAVLTEARVPDKRPVIGFRSYSGMYFAVLTTTIETVCSTKAIVRDNLSDTLRLEWLSLVDNKGNSASLIIETTLVRRIIIHTRYWELSC
jgi:hypothetical protein